MLPMTWNKKKNITKQAQPIRGYTPVNQGPLFDDDPGIMSEVETASTGFRRGGKQRSSLPVVRTPSKTLERPLGMYVCFVLVFFLCGLGFIFYTFFCFRIISFAVSNTIIYYKIFLFFSFANPPLNKKKKQY